MHKRWIAGFATFLFCTTAAGCEITASAYLQHEYNTDPRLHSKPDGLAKAEIKITRLIGKDAKKRARNWNRAHFAAIPTS